MCWCTPEIRAPFCANMECREVWESSSNKKPDLGMLNGKRTEPSIMDRAYSSYAFYSANNPKPARFCLVDSKAYLELEVIFQAQNVYAYSQSQVDALFDVQIVVGDFKKEFEFVGMPRDTALKLEIDKIKAKGGQNGNESKKTGSNDC